jgi:CheY-like chemotaxis protein/signal transduction histidine kinase
MKTGNLRIGPRLYSGFLLNILVTMAVGIVALFQMGRLGELLDQIYRHPLTVGHTARDIRGDINAMHDLVRRISFSSDPAEVDELEYKISELEAQIFRQFDIIDDRYLGPKEDAKIARQAFADWRTLRAQEFWRIRTEGLGKLDKSFLLSQQKYVEDLKGKIQKVIDFSGWKAQDFLEASIKEKAYARTAMIGLIVAALVFGLGLGFLITRSITPSLQLIVQRMRDISRGDLRHDVEIAQRDEIGELADSFREMQASLRDKAEVAMSIAAGDFSRMVEVRGDNDQLGNAINQMTENLRKSKAESDLQDWNKTGKNELNRIIVGEGDSSVLARKIISFLARYLGARIGTLYLAADDGSLVLSGSYAFSKRKSLAGVIEMGEGLVGQAAVERDIISITNIPDDYIRINSSFGDSPPRNVVAVPFLFENMVKGVIELGSFEEFSDEKLDMLRDVSGSIAIAFHTVQNQTRLKVLLEETQRQATQLQVQEEELRTANEELEEQTGSLRLSEEKLKQQQEELRVINEELEEKNEYLEKQKEQIAQKNRDLEGVRRELERRARELEVTSKYKSEFLANMSHELRTPLNSLLLLSRDLADNTKGNLVPEQVESAKIIYNSGAELLQLIGEILDLSKIEAGKMTLRIGDVPLQEIAGYVESSFKHMATEKGIGFKTVMDDTLPEIIKTDAQRLQQILKNLLSNAIKFTEKGSVTVEIHGPSPGANLSRSGLMPGGTVAFSVRDTGTGIPEDKHLLVFEAFQQADGGTTRKYGGTGLGLSISRELARLLGGEIQLESRPSEGSTFTLYLPLELTAGEEDRSIRAETRNSGPVDSAAALPVSSARSEATVPVHSLPDDREDLQEGDKSILIIEDDANFAQILVDQCHSKGFKALVSSTGEAGLSMAEKYLPAAVILDIKLPGMNGWTVLNALKENPQTRHIPVHIMTIEDASINALQKGAIGFLNKPVNREDLDEAFKRIEELVEKKIKDLLLVEDNARQRFGIVNLIADSDVKIVEVESGAEALAALRSGNFDCMILDLGLPDMTGFDLLNRMEEEKDIGVPPVIVYTGRELNREEEMELRKHAESIIIKGVRSEERLLDETALFLHKTVSSMSPRRREMIINLHDKDAMFEGKTILLVDDDMRNLFALSKILSGKGMNIIKAEDGMKALEALERYPNIDLVLLDVMMPVMDGFETAKAIRKKARFADLPIINLTAKAMKDDRDKCIAAGANDYLAKPVDMDRLLSMLRVWLYKR